MYAMETDTYSCDICGFEGAWDITDDVHGQLWGCEKCGATFCTKCFIDTMGQKIYWDMMRSHDLILCPECYLKEENHDAKYD